MIQKVMFKWHKWFSQVMKNRNYIGTGGRKNEYDIAIALWLWRKEKLTVTMAKIQGQL